MKQETEVHLKRLKEVVVGKKEFEQQMEFLGRVGQHPNVVPLRAYYFSKDEKLLVYNYMPAGSLFMLLHGMLNLNPDSYLVSFDLTAALLQFFSTNSATENVAKTFCTEGTSLEFIDGLQQNE